MSTAGVTVIGESAGGQEWRKLCRQVRQQGGGRTWA